MRNKIFFVLIMLGWIMSSCSDNKLKYPVTKQVDTVDVYFGKKIHDPYRWLENPNSKETQAWIKAQNELTFDYLRKIPFRDKIKKRLSEVFNYTKYQTPFKKAGKYFYLKIDGHQNQYVLYWQKSLDDKPKVLLDPNKLSEKGEISLVEQSISGNGKYLAYALASAGSDWRTIYVKNILTGEHLKDKIEWVKYSEISWYKDGFYYCRYPQNNQNDELTSTNKNHLVYYHKLGTDQIEDTLIYSNNEFPDRYYRTNVTDDEKYLVLYEYESPYGNKVYIKNLEKKESDFISLNNSFDYKNLIVGNIDNKFYFLTNHSAPKNKLLLIEVKNSGQFVTQEIIPESKNLLQDIMLSGDKIVAKCLVDVHSILKFFDIKGSYLFSADLPEYGNLIYFSGKYGDYEAFYSFSSYTMPITIYKYDMKKNISEVLFKPKIDFNSSDYITKLEFYQSKDGTKIPLYIVHKKGIRLNGQNPALLQGYGGFNVSKVPQFNTQMIFWLENGGIYAFANIRGGGEYGEEWHKAGIKLKKQNVFDDFISAAEYLIQQKYTSPDKLTIEGRSNGGLLVGAVINQRPDLFKVALPEVGVMDMLRFSKFTIGWAWVCEYGSVEDSSEFENLLSISPLHNINSSQEYPAVLVTTADHDDRVVPAHSFKYISNLQNKYKGPNPVLIRIQTNAGHGGPGNEKPVSVQIDESADIFAFIYHNIKINPFN